MIDLRLRSEGNSCLEGTNGPVGNHVGSVSSWKNTQHTPSPSIRPTEEAQVTTQGGSLV